MATADEIIRELGLAPHPEGGHYRETWRCTAADGERSPGTAIYYLLARGESSQWHRIDADEVWHWYAGAPLALTIRKERGMLSNLVLGPDLASGARPQAVVPGGDWQSARSLGDWSLLGCTVSPGFEFAGFELAPADFEP